MKRIDVNSRKFKIRTLTALGYAGLFTTGSWLGVLLFGLDSTLARMATAILMGILAAAFLIGVVTFAVEVNKEVFNKDNPGWGDVGMVVLLWIFGIGVSAFLVLFVSGLIWQMFQ